VVHFACHIGGFLSSQIPDRRGDIAWLSGSSYRDLGYCALQPFLCHLISEEFGVQNEAGSDGVYRDARAGQISRQGIGQAQDSRTCQA
jgi:hypothetical protein